MNKSCGRGEVRLKSMIDDKFIDPGAEGLMLFEPMNVLARKVINDAHDVMHSGVKHTLARSRSWCWIVRGKKLAEAVVCVRVVMCVNWRGQNV